MPAAIQDTHRIYYCGRCRKQVVICSRCDRGQIYCSDGCSDAARERSSREAGKRYQESSKGQENHARRQKSYRTRSASTVTHQGSPETAPVAEERAAVATAVTVTALSVVTPAACALGAPSALSNTGSTQTVPIRSVWGSRELGYRCCSFCGQPCGALGRVDFLSTPGGQFDFSRHGSADPAPAPR